MSLSLSMFAGAGWQFFTDTGSPLSGGLIYAYSAGSTTPATTYTSSSGAIANSNPIVLNAAGRVPYEIWVTTGSHYKFILKTSTGTTIGTYDNISSQTDIPDYAASNGATLIGYIQGGTGSVARTTASKLQESVSVIDFGADPTGVTDSTTAIQAAINAVNAAGGGIVLAPAGTYIHTSLSMKPKVRLVGQGQETTIFKSSHTGYGLKMLSTINSSISVQTSVENMQFWNTNASNADAGYADVGGSFVNLFNVKFNGFKYGVIFDQTELATIRQCQFAGNIRSGLWLVNGAEYTVGALGLFTNRIDVSECQFNEGASAYCVIDDGGYAHSFDNNNYNGGLNSILVAAAEPISITNSEFESAASTNIIFSNISAGGVTVGQSINALLQSNIIVPQSAQSCISSVSGPSELVLINNSFGNSTAAKIIGLSSVNRFIDIGNHVLGGPYFTGTPTNQFRDLDTGTFTPVVSFGGASVGITYTTQLGKYTRVGNVVTYTIQINLSSKGSSTGSMQISGLPYTSISGITQSANPGFATGIVTATSIGGWITTGSSVIQLQNSQVNYSATLTDANVSNTTVMYFTGSYLAT